MRVLILILALLLAESSFSGGVSVNGVCEFTSGTQYSNGATVACACTWPGPLPGDINCAYGSCGNAYVFECLFDCNGGSYSPPDYVWHQGGGSAGYVVCSTVLPVDLTNFYGNYREGVNEVVWETTSENNCDYFELYHSLDAQNFEKLVELDGYGTTGIPQTYTFNHLDIENAIHYYRLRQVDFDGEFFETYVIAIDGREFDGAGLFSDVIPNPAINQFHFNYGGHNFEEPINVEVYSLNGALIQKASFTEFNNYMGLSFDVSDYDNGFYWVIIQQGEMVEQKKLSVVH